MDSHLLLPADPWITIEGQDDYVVLFPPDSNDGRFMVNIYTTAEIRSLDVADNEDASQQITVRFHSFSIFEVVAKFEIILPREGNDRREKTYTIHLTNDEGKTATQEVRVVQTESEFIHVCGCVTEWNIT